MKINTNLSSMEALNALNNTTNGIHSSLQKLATGLRINGAADDPSGLAISQSMTAQINGLNAAQQNAQDGVSALQTAEGGLNTAETILQRVNTLAVRSANDATLNNQDKSLMQSEVNQLTAELDRMSSTISFNGMNLLDGSYTNETLQVADKSGGANQFQVSVTGINSQTLGISGLDLVNSASNAISLVNSAIDQVSNNRGSIGAYIDRLNYTVSNISIQVHNASASVSQIQDVDMATEMSTFSKLQILQQSGTAMLAQANQLPQAVLKLLS
jgi:flagellin